jgi:hypothetical protein
VSIISVYERREAKGLDAHVPLIQRGDALYDPDLDRFFLDLPLSDVRSRHSLRAYAYDVVVWLRFLDACGKTVWAATRDDVDAYHRERRRDEADHRITAASWNRAVASLDRLYRWGEQQGLITDAPFSRRAVWRPAHGGRRGMIAARNDAYERVARRSDVRFVTMDDYRIFGEVGLRGLTLTARSAPALATVMGYATRCSPIFSSPLACASKRRRACSPPSSRRSTARTAMLGNFGCLSRRRSPRATGDAAFWSHAGCFVRSPPMLPSSAQRAWPSSPHAMARPASSDRSLSPAPVSTACAMSAPRRNDAA